MVDGALQLESKGKTAKCHFTCLLNQLPASKYYDIRSLRSTSFWPDWGPVTPCLLKKEPLTDLSKWQRRIISSRMSDSINLPYPRQGLRQPSDQRQSLKHVGKVALATSGTGHWNLVLQGRCVADGYGYIPL